MSLPVKTLKIRRMLTLIAVHSAKFDLVNVTFEEMLRLLRNDALQQHLVLPGEVGIKMQWFDLHPDPVDLTEVWTEVGKDGDWTHIQLTATAVCRTEEDVARDG